MNKRQKAQLIITGIGVILLLFWLFTPGWEKGKILGLLSNVLLIASMLLSYFEEKKRKKDKN